MQLTIFGTFFIILAAFYIKDPAAFSTPSLYSAILSLTPIMLILSMSETLIVINGDFDMSFPSIMGFSAMIFMFIFLSTGNSIIALLGALCVSTAVGVLNGVLVAKLGLPSLIATIGGLFLWRGVVTGITQGQSVIPGLKETPLYSILVGEAFGFIPVQTFWAIGIMILFWFILNRHKFGAHIYCIGDNRESAKMMGINVARTKILIFTLMGFFSGFAGVMNLLEMGIFFPSLGQNFFLPAIAAVFVGGTSPFGGEGTVFGSFFGGLILGLLDVGIPGIGLAGLWREMFYGMILIISLIVQASIRRRAQ
ncbi:MAG: ABC transporter permease [Nitrososphaeria archaeon]